jgi:hypothetical protein
MTRKAFIACAIALLLSFQEHAQIPTFQKKFGGPLTDEVAYHVIELPGGGYLIAGFTVVAPNDNRDALLLRLDAQGNLLWQRTYGGAGDDFFSFAATANDGGFLAMGQTSSTGKGQHDALLMKIDDNGNLLWSKTLGGMFDDGPGYQNEIVHLQDGYLVSGHQSSFIGSSVNGSFVLRLDNNGNIIWRHGYNTMHDNFMAATYVEGNIAYLSGWAEDDACFAKLDLNNGNILFSETLGGSQTESLFGVKPTLDGNLLLSDATSSPNAGAFQSQWVVKMSKDGDVLSSRVYALDNHDFTGLAIPTADGGYLLGSAGPRFFATSGYMAKVDGAGAVQWAYQYGGTQKNVLYHVIACSDGGYLAVGNTGNHFGFDDDDILVVKVDAAGLVAGCCPQPVNLQVQDFNPVVAPNTFSLTGFTNSTDWNAVSQVSTLPASDYCSSHQPLATYTVNLYPNQTYTIQGIAYTAPDTITVQAPATPCDSLITYRLILLMPPLLQVQTVNPTCAAPASGQITVVNQPTATFSLNGGPAQINPVFSNLGAGVYYLLVHNTQYGFDQKDTITLLLNTIPNFPTANSIQCPGDVTVQADPGMSVAAFHFTDPVTTTNCPCPGGGIQLIQGLPSGSDFPVGPTTVCFQAKDSCGNVSNCCFKVTVEDQAPCDVKNTDCVTFELTGITRDARQRKTYRIRVTNHCNSKLLYLAIQQPSGVIAALPLDNTVYAASGGHTYEVRNPNYAPFYSIRFTPLSDGIHNGGSDVFSYTLPPQADPTYIHLLAKLETLLSEETYLNVFNCPVSFVPGPASANRDSGGNQAFSVFPNPTNGDLFADLSSWKGETVQLTVFDAQGNVVHTIEMAATGQAQPVDLPRLLPAGLYRIVVKLDGKMVDQKKMVMMR